MEQTFVVNDNEYDWIIIESQESISPGNCRTYLLIDNVSLQRSCELSCDQSSGAINSPTFINTPGQWWGISNIDNVTEAIIDIYTIVGQSFVRRIYKKATNGIKHPIYWDGKDENNNSVATAAYIAQITLKNDCDEKNFGQVVSHKNINHNLSPPPNNSYYIVSVKIPRPCCAGIQDYYLSNVVLEAPYEWNYVIYGNLYLNNVTIQPGAIVNFQSGGDIYSGFTEITALPGVESFQYNTPCTPQRIALDEEEGYWENVSEERIYNTEHFSLEEKNSFHIYPNPTKGMVTVIAPEKDYFTLVIYSNEGKSVYEEHFFSSTILNLSDQQNGLYLIKLSNSRNTYTKKIILD